MITLRQCARVVVRNWGTEIEAPRERGLRTENRGPNAMSYAKNDPFVGGCNIVMHDV
jgi:hypothetical protein